MEGLLLVDKPETWTSFDVVKYIRNIVSKAETKPSSKIKVGHSGTLDPFATGLLIILVGNYTKQAERLIKQDKTYEVEMKLGMTSSTGDPEGVLLTTKHKKPSHNAVLNALAKFKGDLKQVPPVYSAIKINGVRAYQLARKRVTFTIEPRKITVYEIRDIRYTYPLVKFSVKVSSGTYIRSLVKDIGIELGCGAYTSHLRRTTIGGYSVTDALPIDNLNQQTISEKLIKL